jgi:hypothetical protein
MINWISVKDRLPEEGTLVLSYGKKDNILSFMYYWREDFLLSGARYTTKVTHWAGFNLPEEKPDVCVWDCIEEGTWVSGCGHTYPAILQGTLKENDINFCFKCGKRIEVKE